MEELYGRKVGNALQRDHSRLILWCASMENQQPIIVDTPTSSLDILPTLSNLFGLKFDSRLLSGRDVFSDAMPLVFNLAGDWKTEQGTFIASTDKFYAKEEHEKFGNKEYIDRINSIVRNKIRFCRGVLETDYYSHVFGESELGDYNHE